MHHVDPDKRDENLAKAREFILLAQQLNCSYIRVFPNHFPRDRDKTETINLIVKRLIEMGDFARVAGVTVLLETHGDLAASADIAEVMRLADHANVGLVWDAVNMWSVTKEPVSQVYSVLKKYIRHVHIKDLKFSGGKETYTLLGKGDTPIFEAIDLLAKDRFSGYYSFEWEKLWHPEIEELRLLWLTISLP